MLRVMTGEGRMSWSTSNSEVSTVTVKQVVVMVVVGRQGR